MVADHVSPPASANAMTYIAEGTTLLSGAQGGTSAQYPLSLAYSTSPTTGLHTYIGRLGEVNAAGTTTLFASATEPAYIMVELV